MEMVGYYDGMLVAIPAAMIAGVVASMYSFIGIQQGLAGGCLVATVILYEMLFRNPPAEPTPSTTAATVFVAIGWLLTAIASI
ncbi:hypothetical protein JCM18237_09750 [Halorubrum luteum]